jgi:tripartite-type tricarboxylate transporter receptor subunit TctC
MRMIGGLVLAGVIVVAMVGATSAQELPNCTVKIVVSGPPGGTPDLIARLGAEKISAGIGRPVVVENRAGGLGAITSIEAVKASEPNGCTLFAANASLFSIMPTIYKKPPFDAANDFIPVSVVAKSPNVLVTNSQFPAKNWTEMIALLKANPGKYFLGSGGIGTPMHLYGQMLKAQFGLEFTHVPYRGSAAAILGLLADQVQFVFEQIPSFLSHVQVGTLRAIAVAGETRSVLLPDVPTLAELGIQDADAASWFGLVAPRGTPRKIIEIYANHLREGVKDPTVVERLKVVGAETVGTTPDEMAAYMASQLRKWAPLVKASGVIVE